MPGRKYEPGTGYRYGFNGKEKDKDIGADDYDFGARIYDGRIARWLAVDRESSQYPSITPYSFAINSPLIFLDPDGNWVAKVIVENGVRRLSFVAEENDNFTTLAMQLGIKEEALKLLDPNLEGSLKEIKTGFEIGLQSLKVVQRINTVLNLDDKKLIRFNCASLAGECSKGVNVDNQYDSNGEEYTKTESAGGFGITITKSVNNVPQMEAALGSLKQKGIEEAQIGSIIFYTPVLEPSKLEESIKFLVATEIEKYKQKLIDQKKPQAEVDKLVAEYEADEAKTKKIYNEKKELLTNGEKHFAILILKDKTGTQVAGIIHKQGKAKFSRTVEPESNATDGGIKYERDSRGSDKSKSFYIHRKAND